MLVLNESGEFVSNSRLIKEAKKHKINEDIEKMKYILEFMSISNLKKFGSSLVAHFIDDFEEIEKNIVNDKEILVYVADSVFHIELNTNNVDRISKSDNIVNFIDDVWVEDHGDPYETIEVLQDYIDLRDFDLYFDDEGNCMDAYHYYSLYDDDDEDDDYEDDDDYDDDDYDEDDDEDGDYEEASADEDFVIKDGVLKKYAGPGGDVVIPDEVTKIGDLAFCRCSSLTSITIPNSVTYIGKSAFSDCTSLTSITIPDSVTSIGASAFYNTGYYNDDSNWENNVLYIGKHLVDSKDKISGAYTIKSGTKKIANCAFWYCTSLTSITIPDSVTSIGEGAFYKCTSLASIVIPNSVSKIDKYAFLYTSDKLVITCAKNSAADEYAKRNEITVEYLD